MLIGELTDLRETQSGKELIQIGKEEGKIEGGTRSPDMGLGSQIRALGSQNPPNGSNRSKTLTNSKTCCYRF